MTGGQYKAYVANQDFAADYSAYQQRYSEQIRESDRVVIEIVRELNEGRPGLRVLDIGCSTGNLLRHLNRLLPGLELTGGDLTPGVLAACRADAGLAGIEFEQLDLLDLPRERFDIVIVNAVLYLLDDEEFRTAAESVSGALRAGGALVAFDFFHLFAQELEIKETSRSHPAGLLLHFRSEARSRSILTDAGFGDVDFRPFSIPIDLEPGSRYRDDLGGFEDLNSYTRMAADGERLLFRGTLFQPWCHLVATKAS
jgi:SAM-dependent methyltransferase